MASHFAGVEHILHAGDVGGGTVLRDLRRIAPVTAVLGNVDFAESGLRLTERVELGGRVFLLHHIVNPRQLTDDLREDLQKRPVDVLVFGHSHVPFERRLEGTLFLNPGYAGMPRFAQPRSLALVHIESGALRIESIAL